MKEPIFRQFLCLEILPAMISLVNNKKTKTIDTQTKHATIFFETETAQVFIYTIMPDRVEINTLVSLHRCYVQLDTRANNK